jgi:tetratricopeptide (TPR) repeat protein
MKTDIDAVISRGLEAVENDDLVAARQALAEAKKSGGENHVGVLHLQGVLAWSEGDVDRAAGFLMQAVDAEPEDVTVYLDCAELLVSEGQDLDEADGILRTVLEKENLDTASRDHALFLLARVCLDSDEPDPEEALELLEDVSDDNRTNPFYASARAEVLMDLERPQEASAAIRLSLEEFPNDADLWYMLGITHRMADETEEAARAMLRTLELDSAEADEDELDYEETQELRSQLESVFEDLPDPLLKRIAHAPITVQARPSVEQVKAGMDPRGVIAFEAKPGREEGEPELAGIIIMRDLLGFGEEELDEEALVEELIGGVISEMQRFFELDELVMSNV